MMVREVKTKVTNAVLYSDGCIRIDNVRASYPHLDKTYAKSEDGKPEDPKFSIVAMLEKATHVAAKDLCVKVIQELAAEKKTKVGKDKWFIKDGDESDKAEYEGYWTVSARESNRPSVRNRKGNVMSEQEIRDIIYAGCRVNVLIRPWYQDNSYGKRVNAGLVAVQFVRDDEQIGEGRVNDDGVFEPIEGDDDGFGDDDSL